MKTRQAETYPDTPVEVEIRLATDRTLCDISGTI